MPMNRPINASITAIFTRRANPQNKTITFPNFVTVTALIMMIAITIQSLPSLEIKRAPPLAKERPDSTRSPQTSLSGSQTNEAARWRSKPWRPKATRIRAALFCRFIEEPLTRQVCRLGLSVRSGFNRSALPVSQLDSRRRNYPALSCCSAVRLSRTAEVVKLAVDCVLASEWASCGRAIAPSSIAPPAAVNTE